jgi:chromosome segregation ATPase
MTPQIVDAPGRAAPGWTPVAVDESVLRVPASVDQQLGAVAIDLVHRAGELVRSMKSRSADSEARARALVKRALELAEARIQTAEAERDQAINQANAKVEELESALTQAQSRIAAAEIEISAHEMRARVAEARASEAIIALSRIEDAIRTEIFEANLDIVEEFVAAAA